MTDDSDLAARLLAYLPVELGQSRLEFAEPPAPIFGGFDTRIFAFRLAGAAEAFSSAAISMDIAAATRSIRPCSDTMKR